MAIRKLLLPLTGTAAGEAALATALTIARRWNAHVLALHVRVDSRDVAPLAGEGLSGAMIEEMMSATEKESSDRAHAVRSMFERFVARHDVVVQEAHPGLDHATASFAAVTGREEDIVAQQARLADLTVVPHPDAGEDVSSSDALHAVLFDSGRPVLISPQKTPATIGTRVCLAWNGTAESASSVLGGDAVDAAGRGGGDLVGRGLSAARARQRRIWRPIWRCTAFMPRSSRSGRLVGRSGRDCWRPRRVRLRSAVDGGVFALAAAAADSGWRHAARAGALGAAGDDEPLTEAGGRGRLRTACPAGRA